MDQQKITQGIIAILRNNYNFRRKHLKLMKQNLRNPSEIIKNTQRIQTTKEESME